MTNPFFKNNGPISILEIIKLLNINPDKNTEHQNVDDVKDLSSATDKDITFLHSKNIKI